jgi:hypothetical protein
MELLDRYDTLKRKVIERKGSFDRFLALLESETTWLTSPASTRYHPALHDLHVLPLVPFEDESDLIAPEKIFQKAGHEPATGRDLCRYILGNFQVCPAQILDLRRQND